MGGRGVCKMMTYDDRGEGGGLQNDDVINKGSFLEQYPKKITPLCFESFVSNTWRVKFEKQIEKFHLFHAIALVKLHLLQFCSISGVNLINIFLSKCNFFSNQHRRRSSPRETMLTVPKSSYRESKLTWVLGRLFVSFGRSFWPPKYTLKCLKMLKTFSR